MSEEKKEEKKSKKSKWLILLLLLIIFALVGVIIFMNKNNKDDGNDDGESFERNVIVNNENVEEVVSRLLEEERVPAGRYEVVMNTTWNFKDGASASEDAYVENVERNTNSVYFDLTLSDTGEVILASPIIPVGMHMDNITLDKALEKGSYDCICTYHLVDEDNQSIGRVNVGVTVNVLD